MPLFGQREVDVQTGVERIGGSRRRTLTYACSKRCVSARPQVMTVALAQWEEPGVCTKDQGRAS